MRSVCAGVATVIVHGLLACTAAEAPARGGDDGGPSKGTAVMVPWRAGNAEGFQMGAVEEHPATSAQAQLPVRLYRPEGPGPAPFVVLLHGCGGLAREAMWTAWVQPWVDHFLAHGVGTAVVDSFGPRGVDQVCNTRNVAAWAVRRADDAYSTRAWLVEQPGVDASASPSWACRTVAAPCWPRCAPRSSTPIRSSPVSRSTPAARPMSTAISMRRCWC